MTSDSVINSELPLIPVGTRSHRFWPLSEFITQSGLLLISLNRVCGLSQDQGRFSPSYYDLMDCLPGDQFDLRHFWTHFSASVSRLDDFCVADSAFLLLRKRKRQSSCLHFTCLLVSCGFTVIRVKENSEAWRFFLESPETRRVPLPL